MFGIGLVYSQLCHWQDQKTNICVILSFTANLQNFYILFFIQF
jgi:hypothetical protein